MRSVLTRTGLQLDPLALSVMSSRLDCAAAQPPTCATNAHVEEGMSHENFSLSDGGGEGEEDSDGTSRVSRAPQLHCWLNPAGCLPQTPWRSWLAPWRTHKPGTPTFTSPGTRRPRRTSRYRSAAGQSENTAVSVSYPPSCSLAPLLQCNTYVDFKFEKTALQWLAIARGHRVIYGVRFNSECATVEAMWAYIVSVLRQILDGKAATLVTNLVSYLAHIVKPDVAGRLFNRPTEPEPECCQWQLYTLAVGAYLSLAAGLSAESVFALQRAYSGFSNTKASTAGHARSSRSGHPRGRAGGLGRHGRRQGGEHVVARDWHRGAICSTSELLSMPLAARQARYRRGESRTHSGSIPSSNTCRVQVLLTLLGHFGVIRSAGMPPACLQLQRMWRN